MGAGKDDNSGDFSVDLKLRFKKLIYMSTSSITVIVYGAIVGGVVLLILIIGGVVFCITRQRRRGNANSSKFSKFQFFLYLLLFKIVK